MDRECSGMLVTRLSPGFVWPWGTESESDWRGKRKTKLDFVSLFRECLSPGLPSRFLSAFSSPSKAQLTGPQFLDVTVPFPTLCVSSSSHTQWLDYFVPAAVGRKATAMGKARYDPSPVQAWGSKELPLVGGVQVQTEKPPGQEEVGDSGNWVL